MANVLVAGSAVLDFVYRIDTLPQTAEKYRAEDVEIVGGGCAANAAVAISRLGGQAQLIARFGRDAVFDLVCADLQAEGVDLSLLSVSDTGRSAVSSVYVDAAGERQIMAFRGDGLAETPQDLSGAVADAVLADTRWPEAAIPVFNHAKALGVPAVLDGEAPVDRDAAQRASHVVFSEQGLLDFAGQMPLGDALQQANAELPGFVAVTCGGDGVRWVDDKARHMPGFTVPVVDTLGAGDVWHGAFTLRLAEMAPLEEAIAFASAVAAMKCIEKGGRKATPSRAQVVQFLEEYQ